MSLTLVGVGHSVILDNLVGSIAISLGQIMSPKKSTSVTPNLHFFSLRSRSSSFIHWRTLFVLLMLVCLSEVVMSMLSMNIISHPSAIISLKELFINLWKVAGELDSPKNMMVGSNSPFDMMKAAFHWLLSLILMLLYPDQMLNLAKMVASFTLSIRSEMRGRGYASLIMCSLTYL